jgi:transcriptional regulator of acetoin/glycerol metabolism
MHDGLTSGQGPRQGNEEINLRELAANVGADVERFVHDVGAAAQSGRQARSITRDTGQLATQVARDLGMSRATLYRRIAGIEAQHWISTQCQ